MTVGERVLTGAAAIAAIIGLAYAIYQGSCSKPATAHVVEAGPTPPQPPVRISQTQTVTVPVTIHTESRTTLPSVVVPADGSNPSNAPDVYSAAIPDETETPSVPPEQTESAVIARQNFSRIYQGYVSVGDDIPTDPTMARAIMPLFQNACASQTMACACCAIEVANAYNSPSTFSRLDIVAEYQQYRDCLDRLCPSAERNQFRCDECAGN